ncbi:MAG: hypothetical protein ACYTHK_03140 [Planctomycetota bacterium]|jgi:hypothetical protein
MTRLYRLLAKVVTVYALFHPLVYLGAAWLTVSGIEEDAMAAGATIGSNMVREGEEDWEAVSGDGTPRLFQDLYWESVFSPSNILLALVMAIGLLGVGAVFHIAATVGEPEPAQPGSKTP